jgi:xylan 1,4-beta-xylosidase
MKVVLALCLSLLMPLASISAQQAIAIRVHADQEAGPVNPVWNYFGYDEPNFTYMEHGVPLLRELFALSPDPVYLRTHNLLTTGDGTPALKWGSTNAYTEDSNGRPVYDWTILDKIFDAYRDAGVRPFVEIGFMPKALSARPEPYQHNWPNGTLWAGWAYPPTDYDKWAELVRQWVLHDVERYGRREVASWYWEVWNEPDIGYWQGTPEEYFKLYDYTADAVKRAMPEARIGGPATTGPSGAKAAVFLRDFLAHCASGKNYATGRTGSPLDFISFHAKGHSSWTGEHVQMGVKKNLLDISSGFEIVAASPKFKQLPIYITESDPEGCAACSVETHPEDGYRNTSQYASYEAEVMANAELLAKRHQVNLAGVLTWAFEFENQPYFAGFRTLATHGIDKPVLNVFRMLGLAGGNWIKTESSGSLSLDTLLASGVPEASDVSAWASRDGNTVNLLVWNYRDDEVPTPAAQIEVTVDGLPQAARRVLSRHYQVGPTTSNAFSPWKSLGSPQNPTEEQVRQLQSAGQLQLVTSPAWGNASKGKLQLKLALPSQAVSLVQITW